MTEAYTTILRLLPELSVCQLADIASRINVLKQFGGKKGQLEIDERTITHLISEVLSETGDDFTNGSLILKRSNISMGELYQKLAGLQVYLNRVSTNRTVQIAIVKVGIGLLCKNLASMNQLVSGNQVLNHIHRLPSLLNRAFPSYASNGLLSLIVEKRDQGEGSSDE